MKDNFDFQIDEPTRPNYALAVICLVSGLVIIGAIVGGAYGITLVLQYLLKGVF